MDGNVSVPSASSVVAFFFWRQRCCQHRVWRAAGMVSRRAVAYRLTRATASCQPA